ncbi:MAG TPA: hypothetical protein VK213_06270 [Bacteroidales bacterium]|nr:hypothetical protein [Bacteroidales bacterium]
MNAGFLKKILPHAIAVILFAVVSFVYFYPVLEGKVLRANDTQVHTINSKEIQDYRDKYHKEPLWTNSIFSGMPAYLISTRYPGNLIKYVDTVLRQFKMPVSVLFVSLLGFYILLIIFGLNPWLSIAGAFAYGFTSFFFQIIAAGHNTQAIALAYMPPLIGSIWYAFRKNALKGALLMGIFLALQVQANHPQITYYALLCIIVFGIVELIFALKTKEVPAFLKTAGILIVPVVIAIGINFASLYTTWEYGKYSIRGKSDLESGAHMTSGLDKEYITHWSYGVDETFNMLIPNYKGGGSHPLPKDSETVKVLRKNNAIDAAASMQAYWGSQPGTEGPHYVGAVVFFLFVLGMFIVKGPEKWWLVSATVLSIMLSWGKNFMIFSDLFIEFFPGYNKFRAVTMTLVIAEFCIPLLGFLALKEFLQGTIQKQELIKKLKLAAGITGGFTILVLLLPGIAGSFRASYETLQNGYPQWLLDSLVTDRKALLRTDAFRSLVFILLAAAVLFAFLKEKIKVSWLTVLMALLILIDLFTIDKRYLNAERFERPANISKLFAPRIADEFILSDTTEYRVLNLTVSTFNDNSPTSYFHHSIGGYHGAKMKRYQELIDTVLNSDLAMISLAAEKAKTIIDFQNVFSNTRALNMLNARYIIINPDGAPVINPNALGNAWFVEKPVIVDNANQELSMIKRINPANEAVVNKVLAANLRDSYISSGNDTILLISYEPNQLIYKSIAASENMAVFSEIYYPKGWKSFIDGKEVAHFRANYILRAMVIPAGEHEIRFSFEPESYTLGNRISLIFSLILIISIAGYLIYSFTMNKKSGIHGAS